MGYIKTFLREEPINISKENVDRFIEKKIEENINLEYKDIKAYSNFNKLSDEVSAFANTEGGLIILGVSEEKSGEKKNLKIYPNEITWGEENLTKERLEDNLIVKIKPNIDGIRIIPIRKGNGSLKVIFLIDIPKSNNSPHMSHGNRYYKRLNFEIKPMEHYEVAYLFKISSTMKEKLIDEIFIPLSTILEKNYKELDRYICPSNLDIENILSKTYFIMNMPSNLYESIYDYKDLIDNLKKTEIYARKELNAILNKTLVEYLKISPITVPIEELRFNIKATDNRSSIDLYVNILYELILSNNNVEEYLNKTYYQRDFNIISVEFSNETKYIDICDFNDNIWTKCLKKSSESEIIIEMKEKCGRLSDYAFNLLIEIVSY